MFKGNLRKSLYVLIGIFMSAVSMQAQAWSFGVSWYSDIDWTVGVKGNKLGFKQASGGVVTEIYAYHLTGICVATNSGNISIQGGFGNGTKLSSFGVIDSSSQNTGKDKQISYAKGTQPMSIFDTHYNDFNSSGEACYESNGIPTGNCTEDDVNPAHRYVDPLTGEVVIDNHICHASATQKAEKRDGVWLDEIWAYIRVVVLDENGDPVILGMDEEGENIYDVKEHGIAHCVYEGELDMDSLELDHFDDVVCEVTEYPLNGEDPRDIHPLN